MGKRLDHTLQLNPTRLKYAKTENYTAALDPVFFPHVSQSPSSLKMNPLEGGKGKR